MREEALRRLNAAAELLPEGVTLLLIEGYRSFERQQELWDKQYAVVRATNPRATVPEIERLTRLSIAMPSGLGGGHQTGGAVDVTLADKDGNEFDMGTTQAQQFTPQTPSYARGLSADVSKRRALLKSVMHKSGFSNFPAEWWHFSFGDQMWAAYLQRPEAIYGPLEQSAPRSTDA